MKIPKILFGTFQTGDIDVLRNAIRASLDAGIYGFDTAPSYGTEEQLGKILYGFAQSYKLQREHYFLSDKIDAWQMEAGLGNVESYVLSALKKMNLSYFDILFIHWPIPEYLDETWKCMLKLKECGLTKEIGICNVRVRHLKEMTERGIQPLFIQIERHPLRTCKEEMEYCKEHGIQVFAYSPLCRMHPELRNSKLLKVLSEKYNKNIGQIILRWQIDTGAVPVFMSQKPNRIISNFDIFDFTLSSGEIGEIETLNQNYKIFLESWGCPGF